jgi:hypothetical protein
MGPVNLIAHCQQMVGFTPTASMAAMGEKLGMNPRIGQPLRCRSGREPCFLRVVALSIVVDDYTKGCYVRITWDTYGWGPYVDWAWDVCSVLIRFPLLDLHQFKSPWLSDMSYRLSCGCEHVDNYWNDGSWWFIGIALLLIWQFLFGLVHVYLS